MTVIPVTGQLGQKKKRTVPYNQSQRKGPVTCTVHTCKSPLTLQSFLTCISPYLLVTNSGKQN